MSHLILIRHSSVQRAAPEPDTDWPLSQEGRDLCIPLSEALRRFDPRVVATSPMRRAQETAEIIATQLGIEWRTSEGLEEHRRPFVPGGLPAQDFQATMQRFFASPGERVFGEESADEARDRFATAIEAILGAEPAGNVAIVSHGTVLALYAAPYFDLQPIDLWHRIAWPSFMVIDLHARRGLHLLETVSPHLPGEGPA